MKKFFLLIACLFVLVYCCGAAAEEAGLGHRAEDLLLRGAVGPERHHDRQIAAALSAPPPAETIVNPEATTVADTVLSRTNGSSRHK